MARLLNWPLGIGILDRKPTSGPRSINATATNSISDFTQSVASPFGLHSYDLVLPACKGVKARRLSGWLTTLHNGANASRVPWYDRDRLSLEEAGVLYSDQEKSHGVPWSNGAPWANGKNWNTSRPFVPVVKASAMNSTYVILADSFWGHRLGYGDLIGFMPFHFGLYRITDVLGGGAYQIWPPLRKAIATTDYATLSPVLVMRLAGSSGVNTARPHEVMSETTISMIEVKDADVREYFTE